jgi:phosphoribosylanthranilate isomerase
MRIKVCGMRNQSNIEDLVKLSPDYIGFIFYPKSKRFIGEHISDEIQALIPVHIQKVGVFVDEPIDSLLEKFSNNQLDLVQLHGSELPEYCERLKKLNIPVIKAFRIGSGFNFSVVQPYNQFCDYFLFDTAGDLHGGNGIQFDWKILDQYHETKPFFLSGGICPVDVETIKNFSHNALYAIDVNSGFEKNPGEKDVPKLKTFMEEIKK